MTVLRGLWPPSSPTPISGASWPPMGGVFVVGSLAWGMLVDGFRPDRYDLVGAALCLAGMAVIMYAPRPS
jgi:small multidrug resistance family-3 protein